MGFGWMFLSYGIGSGDCGHWLRLRPVVQLNGVVNGGGGAVGFKTMVMNEEVGLDEWWLWVVGGEEWGSGEGVGRMYMAAAGKGHPWELIWLLQSVLLGTTGDSSPGSTRDKGQVDGD
ncbi:hypothetical protein V6N11_058930 [Hibiscus sabdariffa]|uniref:Uncharacterized protein n=1 Tax=Hibiscus sabdariffa TaxID=183260 RepID=A0ABR2U5V8_9ROSI